MDLYDKNSITMRCHAAGSSKRTQKPHLSVLSVLCREIVVPVPVPLLPRSPQPVCRSPSPTVS